MVSLIDRNFLSQSLKLARICLMKMTRFPPLWTFL
jgi:hypothetical protein